MIIHFLLFILILNNYGTKRNARTTRITRNTTISL